MLMVVFNVSFDFVDSHLTLTPLLRLLVQKVDSRLVGGFDDWR